MGNIILDFGSGNTCKNKKKYVTAMYDKLKEVDQNKHHIVVKWQLFKVAGSNIPLDKEVFEYAYNYGNDLGYQVTASVADLESLDFLLNFNVPFVKIANNRSHDILINTIPDNIPIYISKSEELFELPKSKIFKEFWCISQYPAKIEEYEKLPLVDGCNISDHTNNFELFRKYNPDWIEWHYKLQNSTGLDSGEFARTPKSLMSILGDGRNYSS